MFHEITYYESKNILNSWGRPFYVWNSSLLEIEKYLKADHFYVWNSLVLGIEECLKTDHFYVSNSLVLGIKKYFKLLRQIFLCLKFFGIRNQKYFKFLRQTFLFMFDIIFSTCLCKIPAVKVCRVGFLWKQKLPKICSSPPPKKIPPPTTK